MSGRFPESGNVDEFRKNLYSGVDMVTESIKDRKFPPEIYGLPGRAGLIKDLSSFDATFFNVNSKQADKMDPQVRLLLETSYEAIVDAGVNPMELWGSKTGVYIGSSLSEADEYWSSDINNVDGNYLFFLSLNTANDQVSQQLKTDF